MSVRMRQHHTDFMVKITIELPDSKKISYINSKDIKKIKTYLEKYTQDDHTPVAWEVLAKERIEKYKKAGLVLRGIRYREGMSQKTLAKKSQVNQTEISKIENGKRTVGEKVAKKLASALNIDYRLLCES